MCKCGQFDTFWHIIDVRIAHMRDSAPVASEICVREPIIAAAIVRADAAATGAFGRLVQRAKGGQFDTLCHIIGVRMAHMGATAPVAA